MSQRDSGYKRKELDSYETPEWVTMALIPHLPNRISSIWEPACGGGKMVRALETMSIPVKGTDICHGQDFLERGSAGCYEAIITNPPYVLAKEFIEHALELMKPYGLVAMLLRADFDSAKTRQHLFGKHRAFAKKVVLTKRIRWIDGSTGAPSFNHCWMVWDWKHRGAPTLAYGP